MVYYVSMEPSASERRLFHLWVPLGLPWVIIFIWFRRKSKIIKFRKGGDAPFLSQLIVWGTMAAMLGTSQSYLKSSTSDLIQINSIDDLKTDKPCYLQIENMPVNKEMGSAYSDFRSSGRYNEHLNIDIYFTYRLQSLNKGNKYWYGKKYYKQISNKISTELKNKEYLAFFNFALKDIEAKNFPKSNYYELLPLSDDQENYIKSIGRIEGLKVVNPIIIEPKKGDFKNRNGNKLIWFFGSYLIGSFLLLLLIRFTVIDGKELNNQKNGYKSESDDFLDMLKFLIPRDDHFATSVLININLLVFIFMIFSGVHILSPNGQELLEWGANRRTETLSGEWWRTISSTFVHAGLMHVLMNVFVLALGGVFIEPKIGKTNVFLLYLGAGVCGSLASIYWFENSVSVGASGAIFGIFGAILTLLLTKAFSKEGRAGVFLLIGLYVGLNLLFGLFGGVDNAAHIGGLISGGIIGLLLYLISGKKES